jgi:hypothetical protein
MNLVKRALVPMLVAALVVPSAASAQEPSRSVDATPPTDAKSLGDVHLTVEGQRSADPWAVFGSGPVAAGHGQPGERIGDVPANGPVAGPTRLVDIEATALAKSRPTAKRGKACLNQPVDDWWANRPGLLLIAIVAGVIVLLATGHSDLIPWLR